MSEQKKWFIFLHLQITHHIFIAETNFSFRCNPTNFTIDPMGMYVAYVGYSYFILKLIDLLDTVFFVLRKKWAQVSFLHVYHHVMTSVVAYIFHLYAPGLANTTWFKCFEYSFECVWLNFFSRWSSHSLCVRELLCTCCDVHVLFTIHLQANGHHT